MFQEWRGQTFPQLIEYSARTWAEKVAIRDGDQSITFAELHKRIREISLALHRVGVRRGDHVAYLMAVSARWVEVFFAVLGLGAKLVPLNLTWTGDEIGVGLRLTDSKYLIVGSEHRGDFLVERLAAALPDIAAQEPGKIALSACPTLQSVLVATGENPIPQYAQCLDDLILAAKSDLWPPLGCEPTRPEDHALLLLTSGTTSFPKPAIHTHETMLCGISSYADGLEATTGDVFLHVTPNYHVGGIISMCIPLLRGGTSRLMGWFDPELAMKLIESEPVSLFWGFDTHFSMMRNHPSYGRYNLSTITRTMSGSNPATFDQIYNMGFKHIGSLYGSTEYMASQAYFPFRDRFDLERMKQSNGRAMNGDVRIIVPETGRQAEVGKTGEICVRGPALFKGYYNMPEETAHCMDADGFFQSGDFGWMDAEGYVYYRGRYKEMIKTGGENVSAAEVEIFLTSEVQGILRTVVCATPHDKWGEAVTAIVEADPSKGLTEESIIEACRGRLAGYKIPKRVIFVGPGAWEVSPTGKLNRGSAQRIALAHIASASREGH